MRLHVDAMLSYELMLSLHCILLCDMCPQSDKDASDDEDMELLNTQELAKQERKAIRAAKAAATATTAVAGRQQAVANKPRKTGAGKQRLTPPAPGRPSRTAAAGVKAATAAAAAASGSDDEVIE
jgi:hypothetical protein